jgi:DNA polymerase III delta prime subunit
MNSNPNSLRATPPLPKGWIHELLLREDSNFFNPTTEVACNGTIALSYFPALLQKLQVNLNDVKLDLQAGFSIRKRQGKHKNQSFYVLDGKEYAVFANPSHGKNNGQPIAVVGNIQPNTSRSLFEIPLVVEGLVFRETWDELPCDLDELFRFYEAGVRSIRLHSRNRERLRSEVQSKLSQRGEQKENETDRLLHREVRKNYGALRTLIRLLEQRDLVTAQASEVNGIVVADGKASEEMKEFLTVRLNEQSKTFGPQNRVEIFGAASDRAVRSRIEDVSGDVLYLARPEMSGFAPGEEVRVKLQPRFSMRSHSDALKQFLRSEVQGDWSHLATLMSAPETLVLETAVLPEHFYGQSAGQTLNEEQKKAVASAITTPHTFFIQGPPGTGKTTAIVEIIQHLVARGERVLMLAPTHVAVDEVLQRVGDREDIMPIRLAWDETKVKEDVRCYTESRVRQELGKSICRPSDSRAKKWAKERGTLQARLDTLADWNVRQDRRNEAALAFEQAKENVQPVKQLKTDLDRELRQLDQELPGVKEYWQARKQKSQECNTWVICARGELNRLKPKGFFQTITSFFSSELKRAEEELGKASNALKDAQGAEWRAGEKHGQLATHQTETLEKSSSCEQQLSKLEAALEQTASRLSEAEDEARSNTRVTARALLGRESDSTETIAELRRIGNNGRRRLARLEIFPELEQHWFELTGLAHNATPEEVNSVAEQIGDDVLDAVNLLCCTTTGIATSKLVKGASFDTLIVDEASRVTDSEFLIGAVKARRWILVGDEHQLPPYVEQDDEFFLHALAALHRTSTGKSISLEVAVEDLAKLWEEEEELHLFRREAVLERAGEIRDDGSWDKNYRELFNEAHEYLSKFDGDPNRKLLMTLRDYLVRSLFERCVRDCSPNLRQRLVVQRRMIEPIARIVKEPIYGGNYETPTDCGPDAGVQPLVVAPFNCPVVFLDTTPNSRRAADQRKGSGFLSPLEQDWVVSICEQFESELRQRGESHITVSILCFYRAQAMAIKQRLGWPAFKKYRVLEFQVIDAIDKIQGQESDLVIISFGRAAIERAPGPKYGQWLQDLRRLNVACTRARRSLVMVGHQATLKQLNTTLRSQEFYKNLFALFEDGSTNYVMIKDYKPGRGK